VKQHLLLMHLKQFFGGIRIRFICYFIIGMILTLTLSSSLSYRTMHSVIERINRRNSKAEFMQIATALNSLYENLNRQMNMLIYAPSIKSLLNYNNYSEVDIIYSINDFAHVVNDMFLNFPYIHSVYLFLDEGHTLCITAKNVRYFFYPRDIKKSAQVLAMLEKAVRKLTLHSGLSTADFQLYSADNISIPLVSAVKQITGGTLVINLEEKEIDMLYSGIASNSSCIIRLVDVNGTIFSSGNKAEIGTIYKQFHYININTPGEISYSKEEQRLLLWYPALSSGNLIITNEVLLGEYWSDLSLIQRTLFLMFFLGLSITCLSFFMWMKKVFSPLNKLEESMCRAGAGYYDQLLNAHGNDEISTLVWHYNEMLTNLKMLTERNKIIEQERRKSELNALRNQINPHFLFNTLNTIKWMAIIANAKPIVKSVTALGNIIAPMFKTDNPMCSLQEELQMLKYYLHIMNMRYGGGIIFETKIEEGLENVQLLRFILQPIIENAIIHGFKGNGNQGTILLKAYTKGDFMYICISDNGTGMSEEELKRLNILLYNGGETKGIGIANTSRRIFLHYGSPYGIRLEHAENGGLCVVLTLPIILK